MIEELFPLRIPAGIYRNGTKYESGGRLYDYYKMRVQEGCRWYDGNGVRFIDGTIRPIGGWQGLAAAVGGTLPSLTGVARGALAWRSSTGTVQLAVGTHTNLYLVAGGATTDITPAGLTVGAADSTYSSGGTYGSGAYGVGAYGIGAVTPTLLDADTWQLDALGNTLAAVLTSDGKLYTSTGGVAAQAAGSPTQNRGVVITPERFLVALGGNDGTGQDMKRAQWADQNTTTVWTPAATNAAGSFPLATNGRLMSGRRTKALTLLFTDADLWTMTYIGGLLVYSFAQVADNCGLVAPNAVAMVGDTAACWMGKNAFWMYDGYVKEVPCEVRDYVFGNFNTAQAAKVWAVPVSEFGEVWWYYPSAASAEIDSYVIFNYRENHWSFGKLSRSAGSDRGALPNPVLLQPTFAATGTLTSDGTNVANNDTVTIGAKTYTFQTTLTNVDGNVHIGASAAASLTNLYEAITLGANSGTDYAAAMTALANVQATSVTSTTLVVRAQVSGTGGNAYATTKSSAHLTWGAATLTGGGTSSGMRTSDLWEHEVPGVNTRTGMTPYLESGPLELGPGDTVARVQRIVPDELTLGDLSLYLFGAMYPTATETQYGPFSAANPTDVRITVRQVRLRLQESNQVSWRAGKYRLGVIAGGRR